MFIPSPRVPRRTTASPPAGRARVRTGRVLGAGFVLAASAVLLTQSPAMADNTSPVSPARVSDSRAVPSTQPPRDAVPEARTPSAPPTARPGVGTAPAPAEAPGRAGNPAATPAPAERRLAETGGDDKTALYIGGAAGLLLLGGGVVVFGRRRGGTAS
ncbi:LPXTG cell wall anchor domain-containing protein (plasmid) [Embleya sp. NBC_00888]|uniref:LAETG motif-containing sortase-dependent surface protein n=1 Tax=Embleya sp. NBC_00888 TaxID=2975960 RepID=UPI002F914A0D|nr:LPXTG cell wall anchor domain-containing protein [Embleya sp. NBC_00888]